MVTSEDVEAAVLLKEAIQRRKKYVFLSARANQTVGNAIPPPAEFEFKSVKGVYHIYRNKEAFCSYDGLS